MRNSHTHTFTLQLKSHREQFGVQYLAQGHFNWQTGGVEDRTTVILMCRRALLVRTAAGPQRSLVVVCSFEFVHKLKEPSKYRIGKWFIVRISSSSEMRYLSFLLLVCFIFTMQINTKELSGSGQSGLIVRSAPEFSGSFHTSLTKKTNPTNVPLCWS